MEQQLKQRLIGVTIIVSLVVIFVPMLFDKADHKPGVSSSGVPPIPPEAFEEKPIALPKSAEDVAPKETEAATESGYKIIPLTDDAPAKPAKPSGSERAEEPVEAVTEEEGFEPVPEEALKPTSGKSAKPEKTELTEKPAQEPKKSKPEPAPAKPKTQAAVRKAVVTKPTEPAPVMPKPDKFAGSEPGRASARREQTVEGLLQTAPAVTTAPVKPVTPKPASQTVQPVKTVPAETSVKLPAQATTGVAAGAAAAKPAEIPPAPQPKVAGTEQSGALAAWVVQTGSFTSEANARSLAEKLRQAKFAAFVEQVSGETGTVFKVQVGPELDRGRAEQMQKQIETNVGIKGIIVPHQ